MAWSPIVCIECPEWPIVNEEGHGAKDGHAFMDCPSQSPKRRSESNLQDSSLELSTGCCFAAGTTAGSIRLVIVHSTVEHEDPRGGA